MHGAQAVVDKQGLTVSGDRGQIKAHPLLSVIRDSRAQFLMALKHLNLDIEPLQSGPGRSAREVDYADESKTENQNIKESDSFKYQCGVHF